MNPPLRPRKQGLYDPRYEHDACGVGFVVDIPGRKSHRTVHDALEILKNMAHRGACGCEANTGDGAGLLLQTPHAFFRQQVRFELPDPGNYAVGAVFLPRDPGQRRACEEIFEHEARATGLGVLGWRDVPTSNHSLGRSALAGEPFMRQVFLARPAQLPGELEFERKLYVARRRAERAIATAGFHESEYFYVASLSSRTLVYKGMLTSEQLELYYPDLSDPAMESAIALVHSRFSTNTFPSWERAHPYRYLIHNGEINTLRGNVNWMKAREAALSSPLFGEDLAQVLPVIDENGSDSAMFDNTLEFLHLTGRPLPLVMTMMIPEPSSNHESMAEELKAFYEFHSCLMEPWDGPASMGFSDGHQVGAVLDRNGLRPSRYYVTSDDRVIMASEVGVLDLKPEEVLRKGRLQPGRMLLIDTLEGRIVADDEVKGRYAKEQPYRHWLKEHLIHLDEVAEGLPPHTIPEHDEILRKQIAFGYTVEDLRILLAPMAELGVEPLGSMGTDTPLAVLSNRPNLLYNYFKQLFAQVTNPPIDSIREEIVTAIDTTIGPERNLLDPEPESCRQIKLSSPILDAEELEKLRHIEREGFRAATLPILFKVAGGGEALETAVDELYEEADRAVDRGANLLILSDRGVNSELAPIPALIAVAGLHHHLIRTGRRMKVGLILESGEPREVHHFALLVGYGAGAIHPYLAFETLHDMIKQGLLPGVAYADAVHKYIKAAVKGVVKVMSKMGISSVQSYCGAQIFEAVGINHAVIDHYFTWTASRIEGVGLAEIAREVALRHERAFPDRSVEVDTLDSGGQYQWRQDGEYHLFNPQTVHLLQLACRKNDYKVFKRFSGLINDQAKNLCTLRGLLGLQASQSVPLEEVEPVETILRRFKSGAMSYGSISREAHESLALAMNSIGGKSNTGEGGEDADRFAPGPGGESRNSAIKQVASGRFGVTSEYLASAKELQIKMAQGAKPGEGGQLPGHKVYPWIAKVRLSTPGVGLISPPPHHDIYSIQDLAELIHDLKNANPEARISVKLVAEVGVGTIAAGVAKGHADVVLISGHDGGTGASPLTSIKHAGLPWELGLAETHQTLVLNNLRDRIVVETDGQLKTGRDVAIAALLGAEEFGFATAPLVTLGCIMMRVCHLNTCPVGVATQDPRLRKKFTGDPSHVVNFMRFIAMELREIMAELGFRTVNEMIGRSDKLAVNKAVEHWKAQGLDLSPILHQPAAPESVGRYWRVPQDHGLERSLDRRVLLKLCQPALEKRHKVCARLPIRNTNRVVGTLLGHELTKRYGAEGLPDGTIELSFHGSAGLSFGAFLPRGITLILEGDSNDYIGKGLSGGHIIVYPPAGTRFKPEENIIVGNVAFYGATSGAAFVRGMAGERFCVRNSGLLAVVEAVGDHGCEYMTGGRVVVLGPVGRNFAAGMSGGIAYILDEDGGSAGKVNLQMVGLEKLENASEIAELRALIERHAAATGSERARVVLRDFAALTPKFLKVMPKDYKRVIESLERVKSMGLSGEAAVMAAFEENAHDAARAGGN